MEQQANYIRRIEIHGLWERFNIGWDLRPDVNILSGINGVGKTTILNRSVGYLEELSGEMKSDEKNGVRLFFDNPAATYIPVSYTHLERNGQDAGVSLISTLRNPTIVETVSIVLFFLSFNSATSV